MDPDMVAKAFVEHYYRTFDTNRAELGGLYQEGSMLTFEGTKIQGPQAIVAKLVSLPFQQCHHNVSTVDCQPSGPAGGMLVFVSGSLQLQGEQHPLKFSQVKMECNTWIEATITKDPLARSTGDTVHFRYWRSLVSFLMIMNSTARVTKRPAHRNH